MSKMIKRKIVYIFAIIFLCIGITILCFPKLAQQINNYQDEKIIEEFNELALKNKDGNNENSINLDKLLEDMQQYNENLYKNGKQNVQDPYVYAQPSFDLSSYGIMDSIFGYIEAPAISMRLPIYLGASNNNMKKGAGNLSQTSVPIGGINTNAALSAHRGMITKTMFDNIVYLKNGDDIYITNFWETLHYKVYDINIIFPNESSIVDIQPNRDLITLITCHPYGSNEQRFVLTCERV